MNVLQQIGVRMAHAVGLLVAVLVVNFLLIHIAPGDPVDVLLGEMGGGSEALAAQIRADYGLDRPLYVQLATYLWKVGHGDLGHSFYFNQPVAGLVLDRMGATLLLVLVALALAICVGVWLGVVSAQRPNGWLSHMITILALAGFSTPVFWLGVMIVILFANVIPIFPVSGMSTPDMAQTGALHILDVARHMVLPVLTLAAVYLAIYSRISRASMLDVLGADYVRTARAKGLSHATVIWKHALRNAILPVVTYAGLHFGGVISGAVLVETVFAWPGLGTLAYNSILRRDTPTLLGVLFFAAILVVVANLATDAVYRLVDPRIGRR